MLDCQGSAGKEGDIIHCTHCRGSGERYWGIQLDQDLLETIISIYPEWFQDWNVNGMATSSSSPSSTSSSSNNNNNEDIVQLLPAPESQIDQASIRKAMDKNKESLKVKLMLRRPISQLVEQGILPPLKTPPAFHEQRQKLERAKMGDFLKNKIQRRPDRQELIQQHILEDTTVDPSLHDKQRQLKKARLADDLNDRLSHRPGPLELVKGNILQTDEKFAQAVKEGQIQFKRTCEGQTQKHPPPRFIIEEDSGSDGPISPPQDLNDQSQTSLPSLELSQPSPLTSQGSPPVDVKPAVIPPMPVVSNMAISITPMAPSQQQGPNKMESSSSCSSTSSKNRKKSKSKAQPKARTIKFHEYKGPPSAQKNQAASPQSETSYELLLQQQQLFLQWQLEWQQKYSPIILPAAQPSGDQIQGTQQSQEMTTPSRSLSKLEDMKVSDLKAELKRRNLPVSGSKPQLIERLKHSELVDSSVGMPCMQGTQTVLLDLQPTQMETEVGPSPPTAPLVVTTSPSEVMVVRPPSVVPMDVDCNSNNAVDAMDVGHGFVNVDIMKIQQKKIEELQRELQRSQLQLQQSLLNQQPMNNSTASHHQQADAKMLQKQLLHQHLQQKIQQQQGQLISASLCVGGGGLQPNATTSAAVKASLAAFLQQHAAITQQQVQQPQSVTVLSPGSPEQALLLCQTTNSPSPPHHQDEKIQDISLPNGHQRTNSLPNFSALLGAKDSPPQTNSDPQFLIARPPPDYDEATKQMNKHQFAVGVLNHLTGRPLGQKSFKSQAVDDVLEILIKNGELPPSAAQEPPTPTTPETAKTCASPPIFPPPAENPQPPPLTPPPSTLLNDTATLDFDFHLDLDDIEAMDFGGLAGDEPKQTQSVAPTLARHLANTPQQHTDFVGLDNAVDMELSDWLDVMIPTTAVTAMGSAPMVYHSNHEHDPLLSNMANSHDPFDLFSVDDVDFKNPTDLSTLSWDKVDFAT